ncbi:MAG: hypothetical protein ACPGO3_02960 [Magnetospiraceae bacterium]
MAISVPHLLRSLALPLLAALWVVTLVMAPTGSHAQMGQTVVVNGQQLSQQDINALVQAYGPFAPGRYWYDPVAGFVGMEGGPSLGQIDPGLPLGGQLRADASGGGTNVFINGREIHVSELAYLIGLYGSVEPGRYWLNANMIGGYEGGPAMFDLNAAANQSGGGGGGGGGSTVSSSDGQSSLSTGSDGCMYFSSGGMSASTC